MPEISCLVAAIRTIGTSTNGTVDQSPSPFAAADGQGKHIFTDIIISSTPVTAGGISAIVCRVLIVDGSDVLRSRALAPVGFMLQLPPLCSGDVGAEQ